MCTRPCTSQYKDAPRDKKTGKCCARIRHKGVPICLGTYDNEIEAARACDRAARQYHGPFARLNFPEEWVTGEWQPVAEEPEAEHESPKTEDGSRQPATDPPQKPPDS